MSIKDVEILLDIPRATVRFYEKEGHIAPTREGNGYRDYWIKSFIAGDTSK